jgi:hypothetical protein
MTDVKDRPIGWAAFRTLRRSPTPIPPRRHGNWIHGRYSESRIEGMRQLRRCVKIIRGAWWLALPEMGPPMLLGWTSYRIARLNRNCGSAEKVDEESAKRAMRLLKPQ